MNSLLVIDFAEPCSTVEDFLKFTKIEYANQPGTYRRYDFACRTLISYFGKVKVSSIETKDIEKFIVWRSSQTSKKTGESIKRKTVNFELLILKGILTRLINDKILRDNPARAVKQLTEEVNNFHVLTNEEEKRYFCSPARSH